MLYYLALVFVHRLDFIADCYVAWSGLLRAGAAASMCWAGLCYASHAACLRQVVAGLGQTVLLAGSALHYNAMGFVRRLYCIAGRLFVCRSAILINSCRPSSCSTWQRCDRGSDGSGSCSYYDGSNLPGKLGSTIAMKDLQCGGG